MIIQKGLIFAKELPKVTIKVTNSLKLHKKVSDYLQSSPTRKAYWLK